MAFCFRKVCKTNLFKACCGNVLKKHRPLNGVQMFKNDIVTRYPNVFVTDTKYTSDNNGVLTVQHFSRNFSTENTPRRLKLMDFKEVFFPGFVKRWRNVFFRVLLTNFDNHFTTQGFLDGAKQAVVQVSSLLSKGNFEALEGLVEKKAIGELQYNYNRLTPEQQHFIAVNESDVMYQHIYEIGMIFDDDSRQRFVEITIVLFVLNGLQGLQDRHQESFKEMHTNFMEKSYICNYRFIREYTKGVDCDWTITALNHFKLADQLSW